eukprot:5018558-Pyramimonas_sp.AAC.1
MAGVMFGFLFAFSPWLRLVSCGRFEVGESVLIGSILLYYPWTSREGRNVALASCLHLAPCITLLAGLVALVVLSGEAAAVCRSYPPLPLALVGPF